MVKSIVFHLLVFSCRHLERIRLKGLPLRGWRVIRLGSAKLVGHQLSIFVFVQSLHRDGRPSDLLGRNNSIVINIKHPHQGRRRPRRSFRMPLLTLRRLTLRRLALRRLTLRRLTLRRLTLRRLTLRRWTLGAGPAGRLIQSAKPQRWAGRRRLRQAEAGRPDDGQGKDNGGVFHRLAFFGVSFCGE